MSQIIEITVSPSGETKLETKSFVGASCREGSRDYEVALGIAASEQLTSEFHQQSDIVTATQQQTN
jgi:hypothetical protein